LTITGHPDANAEATSPPATEKANGKLPAQNTTTGPEGINIDRRSGFGNGARSGRAVSIRTSAHDPSSIKSANILNCAHVRARSPSTRPLANAVSAIILSTKSPPNASICIATARKNPARFRGDNTEYERKAEAAKSPARATSDSNAPTYTGSKVSPVNGLTPEKAASTPTPRPNPIIDFPDSEKLMTAIVATDPTQSTQINPTPAAAPPELLTRRPPHPEDRRASQNV
jgi:hypothetical protein